MSRKYCNIIFASTFLAFLGLLSLHSSALAQADISDVIGSEMQKKVKERIEHGLKNEKKQRDTVGKGAAEIIQKEGSSRNISIGGKNYQKMPAKHPLLDNDGADPSGKSKEEYTKKDTEAIFNDETFGQCLEDRQVFDSTYHNACAEACPGPFVKVEKGCRVCDPALEKNCVPNHFYVSELYFPVYETRTYPGRAMGSFDPAGDYLAGSDKRSDLKLGATKQRYHSTGKQIAEEFVKELIGKDPNSISDKLYPDWYKPDVEWYGHDGNTDMDPSNPDSYHSMTYQTNAHRQATRRRPQPDFKGYKLEKNCLFHTLDNPAKDVIAGASYGNKDYMRAAMAARETKNIDSQAAQATVLDGGKNALEFGKSLKANGKNLPQELQGLTPSQRMNQWKWLAPGLERIGVKSQSLKKEYVFYGHTLAPYNTSEYNSFVDPFYASVSNGFSHYMLSSLPEFKGNQANRRALRYSYHTAKGSRPNYSGEDPQVEDKIIFTDKMQIIYPPWKDGGERQGSHCFRPESITKLEPGEAEGDLKGRVSKTTSSQHFSLPLEIRKRFAEKKDLKEGLAYANEVRIAYYIKRVNCYCTMCGKPYGCTVLNDGDQKEDNFYGTTPLANSSPQLFVGGSGAPAGVGRTAASSVSKAKPQNEVKRKVTVTRRTIVKEKEDDNNF